MIRRFKKAKKINAPKLPPMHLACSNNELRTSMQCVHIQNGIATATDAHILVRYDLSSFFEENILKKLDGKLIHMKTWEMMAKTEFTFAIKVDEDEITIPMMGGNFVSKYANEKFPDFAKITNEVLDGKLQEAKSYIGLNTKLLSKASLIIGYNQPSYYKNQIVLHFNQNHKAIVVSNENVEEGIAIVMPVMVKDEYNPFKSKFLSNIN